MSSKKRDDSKTVTPDFTTAGKLGKKYNHQFKTSDNPDKSAQRQSDGTVSSGEYLKQCEGLEDYVTPKSLQLDFEHPMEKWVSRKPFRWLLGRICKNDSKGVTALEKIIASYRNPDSALWHRIKYKPLHLLIDKMRGDTDVETFRKKLADNAPTVRGIVIVGRSLNEHGLCVPQKFSTPLFAVWNFTNRCNLKCRHCYQDSEHNTLDGELNLEQKLDLVNQMGQAHMPMLALSGGEPTLHEDLIPILERAKKYRMHTTIATNGTVITEKMATDLRRAGLRYVEISLDSVKAQRHDAFRGVDGMWERAVRGAKIVAKTEGLRLGIAMCVHPGNIDEVEQMIDFAESIGASCFAHFNFIPVGRGLKMVSGDITPTQREKLLGILNRRMQNQDGIGIISTAPQLGRVCLAGTPIDGKATCSHAGSGSGIKARVVAKYLGGCGAGRTYVCIEPDGNVTPCVYLPHRVMGNVKERPLNDIFRSSIFHEVLNDRDLRTGHCEVCTFRNYCGGCRARADAYFGELNASDPGCVFNDKSWNKLVEDGVAVIDSTDSPEDMDLPKTRHGLA